MNRGIGGRRSPEAWSSAHDRARARLAERMTEPLEVEESAWLDAHLVDCSACREIDTAYRSDRDGLRAMRVIPPPRDLWARTSAALDAEQGRAGGGRRSRPARRRTGATGTSGSSLLAFPGGRWAPLGALGSIAAVMVVGFLLGNSIIGTPTSSPGVALGSSATLNPVRTPNSVPQADVAWVSVSTDGSIVVRQAPVNDVCPAADPAACPPLDRNATSVVTLAVQPTSVHQSPTSGQMIVVGRGEGPGQAIYVIDTGKGAPPTATPSVPTTPPTATPTTTPTPPGSGGPPPGSGGPSTSPGSGTPTPTTASMRPSSTPTASVATTPSATPKPTSTATIVPNVTPAPSAATLIAIATDVGVLNAETAAYSPDGAWFSFTARAANDPTGSDIYLWHAGDAQAKNVTNDGRSVFAGWVGERLVGSRAASPATGAAPSAAPASGAASAPASGAASAPASGAASAPASAPASADTGEFATTSFLMNPATLARTTIPTAAWRPAVDPTGRFVVYWEGTVAVDPLNGGWQSATGRLVIRAWPVVTAAPAPSPGVVPSAPSITPTVKPSPSATAPTTAAPSSTPGPKATKTPPASPTASASASAAPSAAPSASRAPSASPSAAPSASAPAGLPEDLASASGVDWAVAWDETGTHLAVWIGDKEDRSFGRLDLLTIGTNGLPTAGGDLLTGVPALPGISLADGHLVWATPPGVNGDGSHLTLFAYSEKGSGVNQGQPGGTVIVIQH